MINAAGMLTINLTPQETGTAVELVRPKPIPVEALMRGRTPADAAWLSGMIFNICTAAQDASVRAAFGLEIPEKLRDAMRWETVRDHVLKLCAVWPQILDQSPDGDGPALIAKLRQAPCEFDRLRTILFGPSEELPKTWGRFEAWCAEGKSAPARLLHRILDHWPMHWGRVDIPLLDPVRPVDWATATQDGGAVENSLLGRIMDHSLITEIQARRGRDIVLRIAARLAEVERILDQGVGYFTEQVPAGAGSSWAARGMMLVRGAAEDGKVTAFERLSPTDFALVEDGLLIRALSGIGTQDAARLRQAARLVTDVIDPCYQTAVTVRLREAADA